ncbi:hypothetical protein AVEN_257837-1 [Araneus ventricosus]|uniref:Uncharacterized protein n=1 Tax=Araneus ventricosus TaxID=182803 RepID=A0A4Y2N1I7_ARAVE|nr:hypothetical protein AVEN_257837-1 [Araneus ventricosus]
MNPNGLSPRNAQQINVAIIAFSPDAKQFAVTNGPFIDRFDVTSEWLDDFKENYLLPRGIKVLLVRKINDIDMLGYLKTNIPEIYVGSLN